MKTSAKIISLLFALEMGAAVTAQLLGLPLPAFFDSAHAFIGFTAASLLLLLNSDYHAPVPTFYARRYAQVLAEMESSAHPLAA